jgi:hypothetical protein
MTHTFRILRRSAPTLVGAAGALALAGCGSGGSGTSAAAASGAPNPQMQKDSLKVSECMRAHGITNFPDPGSSGGIQITPSSGLNPQSPAFQSAMEICQKLLPGGGPGAHPMSARQRQQIIAQSQCMRTHGVPDYPDPTFLSGGVRIQFPPNIDPNSPAFENAAKECNGPVGLKRGGGFAIAIGAKRSGSSGK